MPDKKLTDNEIIKALEMCQYGVPCEDCPYDGLEYCRGNLSEDARNLINRQKEDVEELEKMVQELVAECERLEQNLEEAHIDIKEHLAEIERLKNCVKSEDEVREIAKRTMEPLVREITREQIDTAVKLAKAEAYKECIETVKTIICDNTYPDFDKNGKAVCIWKPEAYKNIDNLLKELVGDSNENLYQ